ncbi:DUF2231 domain-containing protein [Petrachloros mirabilis]
MHPIHPMLVHFPIALLSAAVLLDFIALRWRPDETRIASLYSLVLGLAGAAVSVVSGALAEESAEHSGVPEFVLEVHEKLGFAVFWIFAALLGLRLAEWLDVMKTRPVASLSVGIVGVLVLFVASYYGGSLVYDYGAGVAIQR